MSRFVVVLGLVVVLAGTASADTVVLKNGRRVDGRLVLENEHEVTIETRAGVFMKFKRREVAAVERSSATAGGTSTAPSNPAPSSGSKLGDEELGLPENASDGEKERLRTLIPQMRETARRLQEARATRIEAEKQGGEAARLAGEKEAEFARQLAELRASREGIDKSIATRGERAAKQAGAEAAQLRAETDRLKGVRDSNGLANRATFLLGRAPADTRDLGRRVLVDEALYAMASAGEIDLATARGLGGDLAPVGSRAIVFARAGERYAWCVTTAEEKGTSDLASWKLWSSRAVEAWSDAHRLSGLRPNDAERALMKLRAFGALSSLIVDRLDERRWGREVAEGEGGRFRLELPDGRVQSVDEAPTSAYARTVQERRDRTENRTRTDGAGKLSLLVKVTRWYELFWDPRGKKWGRECPATQLEASKLVPLLKAMQERADAIQTASAQRDIAAKVVRERRAAYAVVRAKADIAEATETELQKALGLLRDAEKGLSTADEALNAAQVALTERLREHALLERDIEQALSN